MPTKFSTALGGPPDPNYDRPEIVSDDSLSNLAAGVLAAGEAYGQVRDVRVLGELEEDATKTISEVEAYERAKKGLLLDKSVSDASKIEQVERQLKALRNGEVQGKISPAYAIVQIRNKIREASIRNPHLAAEFRKLHSLAIEGVSQVVAKSDENDPDVEAAYFIVSEAEKNSMTPGEYRQRKQLETRIADLTQENTISSLIGENRENTVESLIETAVNLETHNVLVRLNQAARSGTLVKEDELFNIASIQAILAPKIDNLLLKDQQEYGGKFDTEFRTRMKAKVNELVAPLVAMANSADSKDKQMRMLEFTEKQMRLKGSVGFMEALGPYAAILQQNGGFEFVEMLMDFEGKIIKGNRESLEAAAATDSKTAMLLQMYDSGALRKILGNYVSAVNKDEPVQPTGNEKVDMVLNAGSRGIALNDRIPIDERLKHLQALVLSDSTSFFEQNLDWAMKVPKALAMLNSDKGKPVKDKVQERLVRDSVAKIASGPEYLKDVVLLDTATGKFVIDPKVKAADNKAVADAVSSPYGTDPYVAQTLINDITTKTRESQAVIDFLNKMSDYSSKLGRNATEFSKDLMTLIDGSVTGAAPAAQVDPNASEKISDKIGMKISPPKDSGEATFDTALAYIMENKLTGKEASDYMRKVMTEYAQSNPSN